MSRLDVMARSGDDKGPKWPVYCHHLRPPGEKDAETLPIFTAAALTHVNFTPRSDLNTSAQTQNHLKLNVDILNSIDITPSNRVKVSQ